MANDALFLTQFLKIAANRSPLPYSMSHLRDKGIDNYPGTKEYIITSINHSRDKGIITAWAGRIRTHTDAYRHIQTHQAHNSVPGLAGTLLLAGISRSSSSSLMMKTDLRLN